MSGKKQKQARRVGSKPSDLLRGGQLCYGCSILIPPVVLRDGHGLMEWCGTVRAGCDVHGFVWLCPMCAENAGPGCPSDKGWPFPR